jgi:hypothetical protein
VVVQVDNPQILDLKVVDKVEMVHIQAVVEEEVEQLTEHTLTDQGQEELEVVEQFSSLLTFNKKKGYLYKFCYRF